MSGLRRAVDLARWTSDDTVRIEHATLVDSDAAWLRDVKRLTLWAVRHPVDLLARLPNLELLDIRGGTAEHLDHVAACRTLRVLVVNQVRGLKDLQAVARLSSLEVLCLFGLPRVEVLPSTAKMPFLTRVELGSMKGLTSIRPLLEAPRLQDLLLIRTVALGQDDVTALQEHPSLARFGWFAEDVPVKTWKPVIDAVGKPGPSIVSPEVWLDE